MQRTVGITDPRKNALFEIVELRDRYLGKLGQDKPYRGNAYFANMREAAANSDPHAFAEARTAYLEKGGDYDRFKRAIANLDPLSARMNDQAELDFVDNYLSPDQKQKLGMARDYARKLEVDMWAMWRNTEGKDSPEIAEKIKGQRLHEAVIQAKGLLRAMPAHLTPKEQAEGKTLSDKRAAWKTQRDAAKEKLGQSSLDREEVIKAFRESLSNEVQSPEARNDRILNLRRHMGWWKKIGKTGE